MLINKVCLVRNRCGNIQVLTKLRDFRSAKQFFSMQANPLRFTQTALINSGGKQKVGAQTCKFQVLIMIISKVMSFRTHAKILLMSWGEVDFCIRCNFRTKQDEGKLTYKSVIQLFTHKTSALILSGWFAIVLAFSSSSSRQIRSPPPDCFRSARSQHRVRV